MMSINILQMFTKAKSVRTQQKEADFSLGLDMPGGAQEITRGGAGMLLERPQPMTYIPGFELPRPPK
jgi:hypothetical protein